MADERSITQQRVLTRLGILPLDAKRIDELQRVKRDDKKSEILRTCIASSEIDVILSNDRAAHTGLVDIRRGNFDYKKIHSLQSTYTHADQDVYLTWAKVITSCIHLPTTAQA
jgi:hypothetical protein